MKKLEFIKSKKLLNIDNNAKTVKGQKYGYMTAVLYLAPSKRVYIHLVMVLLIVLNKVVSIKLGGIYKNATLFLIKLEKK